jgi:hypothetical protein
MPGDLLDPLGRDTVSGLADLHPISLFEDFVGKKTAAGDYDVEFAERFRVRGRAALENASRRLHEASANEGAGS